MPLGLELLEFLQHFDGGDGSAGGVAGAMAALLALLAEADAELAAALVARGVNPQFFAFRWITTALTQVCR